MRDYANQRRSKGNLGIFLGTLVAGRMLALGSIPETNYGISQTAHDFLRYLSPEKKIICKYVRRVAVDGDNARTLINIDRGSTPTEIGTSRLIEMFGERYPEVRKEGVRAGRVYEAPTDCRYQ